MGNRLVDLQCLANSWLYLIVLLSFCGPSQAATPKANCESLVLYPNSSMIIKSLSMLNDEVVLLFGSEFNTSDVSLARFTPKRAPDPRKPLFKLGLDEPFKSRPLHTLFRGVDVYAKTLELVSLLYVGSDQLAIIFFRASDSSIINVVYHNGAEVKLKTQNLKRNDTVLLLHTTPDNHYTPLMSTFFISLRDPAYLYGLVSVDRNQIYLKPNQTRLLGTDQDHSKLYLLIDKVQSQAFIDYEPLSNNLAPNHWRALLYNSYIYLLSGHKAGSVFYFRPPNLSLYDEIATMEIALGVMSYAQFFGCDENADSKSTDSSRVAEPTFQSNDVLVHSNFWLTDFSFWLFALVLFFTLLIILVCYCYTPTKRTRRRRRRSRSKASSKSNSSMKKRRCDAHGYNRCHCSPGGLGHCQSESLTEKSQK